MFRDRFPDPAPPSRSAAPFWTALVVALSLFVQMLVAGPALASEADPTLLLLPFVVHSAEAPEYVRGGLSDMLSARFSRIGGLKLLREEDPDKGTSSLDEALAIARAAGADFVLFGSFTRFGKGASLDVQCAPAVGGGSREPLREIFVHSGSIGEIIPDLDELAGKVSRFARGENVEVRPAVGTAPTIPTRELRDLASRVTALEAELASLRDSQAERDGESESGAER